MCCLSQALFLASLNGHLESANLLLEAGVDPNRSVDFEAIDSEVWENSKVVFLLHVSCLYGYFALQGYFRTRKNLLFHGRRLKILQNQSSNLVQSQLAPLDHFVFSPTSEHTASLITFCVSVLSTCRNGYWLPKTSPSFPSTLY